VAGTGVPGGVPTRGNPCASTGGDNFHQMPCGYVDKSSISGAFVDNARKRRLLDPFSTGLSTLLITTRL
jgi:hypothetical protein